MVKRSIRIRVIDMLTAIDEAMEIMENADFSAYRASVAKRRGVERCIEIISEASRHIPESLTTGEPDIPWPEIKAIGNKLRHEYQRVEDLVLWRTANQSLPELKLALQRILTAIDADSGASGSKETP